MSTPASGISGKLLIVILVAIGLAAAAASWWFRYAATHRAAQFWGPEVTRLIRDAPEVTVAKYPMVHDEGNSRIAVPRDISNAPGLTHLRTALLEDRSFDWLAPESPPTTEWTSQLRFRDRADSGDAMVTVFFSPDFRWAFAGNEHGSTGVAVSCRPIAAGLQQFFAEQTQDPPPER